MYLGKNKRDKNTYGYRVISTARTLADINDAIDQGFIPIIREITEPKVDFTYFSVTQYNATREISIFEDVQPYRGWEYDTEDEFKTGSEEDEVVPEIKYKTVIGTTCYYPKTIELPFAAYLIPPDALINEMFYVADLIEDFIGMYHNRGYFKRLEGCEALWDGADLEIKYDAYSKMTICKG